MDGNKREFGSWDIGMADGFGKTSGDGNGSNGGNNDGTGDNIGSSGNGMAGRQIITGRRFNTSTPNRLSLVMEDQGTTFITTQAHGALAASESDTEAYNQ
jgi:hypothetical protein